MTCLLAVLQGINSDVKLTDVSFANSKHASELVLVTGAMTAIKQVSHTGGVFSGTTHPEVCTICTKPGDAGCHPYLSTKSYNQLAPYTSSLGLVGANFALSYTPGPEHKPWDGLMGYPIVYGRTVVSGVTFADFGGDAACGGVGAYAITSHAKAPDAAHPIYLNRTTVVVRPTSEWLCNSVTHKGMFLVFSLLCLCC